MNGASRMRGTGQRRIGPQGQTAGPGPKLKRREPCLALGCNKPRARPMEQTAGVVRNHESGTRRRVGIRSAEGSRQRGSGVDTVGSVGRRAPQMNPKRGGLAEWQVPGARGRSEGEGKTTRVAPVVHLNGHTEPPSVGQALKAQPAMDKGHEGCSKLPSELRRCTVDGTGRTGNCATRTDEP